MTAKIFRNAFLIGFTVLLACMLLFFFIMYSNYQEQAFDILQMEASQISEGMDICGGETYLSSIDSPERVTWIAADGSVLYDNMADPATMENHLQRPEVAEAFETGSGRSISPAQKASWPTTSSGRLPAWRRAPRSTSFCRLDSRCPSLPQSSGTWQYCGCVEKPSCRWSQICRGVEESRSAPRTT